MLPYLEIRWLATVATVVVAGRQSGNCARGGVILVVRHPDRDVRGLNNGRGDTPIAGRVPSGDSEWEEGCTGVWGWGLFGAVIRGNGIVRQRQKTAWRVCRTHAILESRGLFDAYDAAKTAMAARVRRSWSLCP